MRRYNTARATRSVLIAIAACGGETPAPAPIRFLHTFGADETELFNATMAERGLAVESSLVPFARGQQVISEILQAKQDCPDLIRIDATWLPGLRRAAGAAAPPELVDARLDCPRRRRSRSSMARGGACPQIVDGLLVVRDAASPAPASREHRRSRSRPRAPRAVTIVAIRSACASTATGSCRGCAPRARTSPPARSTARRDAARSPAFAALFGDVAAPPPPAGERGARRAAPLACPRGRVLGHRAVAARRAPRSASGSRSARSRVRRAAASSWSCPRARSVPDRGLAARGRAHVGAGPDRVRRGVRDGADAQGRARGSATARPRAATKRCGGAELLPREPRHAAVVRRSQPRARRRGRRRRDARGGDRGRAPRLAPADRAGTR